MPHGAGGLTPLLHLCPEYRTLKLVINCTNVPGGEHQALTDAACLQVVLVHLHVLAEADQHPVYMCTVYIEPVCALYRCSPVPSLRVAPKHDLEDGARMASVTAQQLPGGQQLVLSEPDSSQISSLKLT